MAIDLKLIDKLLADHKKPEDMNGLLKQLTKALLERAMQAEMTEHLGYEKHDTAGHNSGNSRNGATTKTLKGDFGEMPLEMDRIQEALSVCDLFISIGTSGNVYPAAGFVGLVRRLGEAHTVEINLEPSRGCGGWSSAPR